MPLLDLITLDGRLRVVPADPVAPAAEVGALREAYALRLAGGPTAPWDAAAFPGTAPPPR